MSAESRHNVILSRINRTSTEVLEDDELTNINRILDVFNDIDLSKCGVTPDRLLECVINIELVLRGVRLFHIFYIEAGDLEHELTNRITETLPHVCIACNSNTYIVHLWSRVIEARQVLYTTYSNTIRDPSYILCTLLDYGYRKSIGDKQHVTIALVIDERHTLYSFKCPVTEYEPRMLEDAVEKATTYNEVLAPLGFKITAKLLHDEV